MPLEARAVSLCRRRRRRNYSPTYLRHTTSGDAGNGLGATTKYLQQTTSGAAGNGLGATIKYLRRTTSSAAGNGLGATAKYLRRRERQLGHHD
jgi:hypothetical protein